MQTRPVLAAAVLAGALTACGEAPPRPTSLPEGVVMHVDQSRMERRTREVFLRVQNPTAEPLTITSFTLTSERLDPVEWTGEETIGAGYEGDLAFDLPPASCGGRLVADVRLTYRVGTGEPRTSRTLVEDPHGAVTQAMDRDCARTTLEEAADLKVGEPTVEGSGPGAVLVLPVTLTPTGRRDDVRLGGFGSTVLFSRAPGSPVEVDVPLGPEDPPAEVEVRLVPARCDAHALAEDKVGRLIGVSVLADDLPAGASFHLPLDDTVRTALYDFFRATCGLSGSAGAAPAPDDPGA